MTDTATLEKYADLIDTHRYIDVEDSYWYEYTLEEFETLLKVLGVDARYHSSTDKLAGWFRGFCSQGDGASFRGRVACSSGDLDAAYAALGWGPDEERDRIVAEYIALQNMYDGQIYGTVQTSGHYTHSGTMTFELDDDYDEEEHMLGNPELAEHVEGEVQQLMRDLADWLYKQLKAEYDYRTSDAAVYETLEANDMLEEDLEDA